MGLVGHGGAAAKHANDAVSVNTSEIMQRAHEVMPPPEKLLARRMPNAIGLTQLQLDTDQIFALSAALVV
jgi:hypothetical protein